MIRFIFVCLSCLTVVTRGWQVSVDFDFKHQVNSNNVDLFETVYARNDYFALLSLNKNNHIDLDEQFMMIGARLVLNKQ